MLQGLLCRKCDSCGIRISSSIKEMEQTVSKSHVRLEAKEVEVALSGFGRPLPTLSFGLTKSAFLAARLRDEEPIAGSKGDQVS